MMNNLKDAIESFESEWGQSKSVLNAIDAISTKKISISIAAEIVDSFTHQGLFCCREQVYTHPSWRATVEKYKKCDPLDPIVSIFPRRGWRDKFQEYLSDGGCIDAYHAISGMSILEHSIYHLADKWVGYILELGANPNCRSPYFGEQSPLHLAVEILKEFRSVNGFNSDSDVINILIDHGARIDSLNDKFQLPCHLVDAMNPDNHSSFNLLILK